MVSVVWGWWCLICLCVWYVVLDVVGCIVVGCFAVSVSLVVD